MTNECSSSVFSIRKTVVFGKEVTSAISDKLEGCSISARQFITFTARSKTRILATPDILIPPYGKLFHLIIPQNKIIFNTNQNKIKSASNYASLESDEKQQLKYYYRASLRVVTGATNEQTYML